MQIILLSIHLLVSICLIGLVLLQRSEGGALGMGGGGGSGSLMSGRGASDALARLTSIAGGLFLVVSLGLTWLSGAGQTGDRSVFDSFVPQQTAPVSPSAPAPTAPAEPEAADPTESSVPASSQMASILPGPAEAAAAPPAPTTQAARAAPLDSRPAPAPRPAVATPASAPQSAPAPRAPAALAPRPAPAPLQIPDTSGAATGLTEESTAPESIEIAPGLEAVRRERAGPDR